MNKPSGTKVMIRFFIRASLLAVGLSLLATGTFAQETGGELGGGAGIFRPKNPEAKRSGGPPKPARPRMSPAEIEANFQDALADGNEARDARKFAAADATAPNDPDVRVALSFALVQPRTGAANAKRFADAEYFAKRATQLAPTNAIAWDRLGVALTAR